MFIDTHCHLYLGDPTPDVQAILARAAEAGVGPVICPAIDLDTARTVLDLARDFPGIYAAVGIHPNYTSEAPADWEDRLRDMLDNEPVVSVGETGLDYYRDYTPFEQQRLFFRRHLALAQDYDRPVIVHNREADTDTLELIRESGVTRGIAHCFSSDKATAEAFLSLGFYISFAGNLTFKNTHLREVAAGIPLERILIETDAPFLSPVPFRGKTNEPARVRLVAEELALVHGKSLDEIGAITTANAKRVFALN